MLRKCLLLLIASLLLLFGGCADSSGSSAGKIIPPSPQVCPLVGEWEVLEELVTSGNEGNAAKQWEGSNVQFADGIVAFGGYAWEDLSYKIKRVNTVDYLLTKYIPPSGMPDQVAPEVDVITVYAASNFLGEIMKIDDKNMIFFVQNKELLLNQISDQVGSMPGAANGNSQDINENSKQGVSGVLLGLRSPSGDGYTYRTFWIAVDHQQLQPILKADQLFFPRTSGFWELSVNNISADGKRNNVLVARNVASKVPEMKNDEEETGDQIHSDPAIRIIDYIGNDYVAIEKKAAGIDQLQVLPVDKLSLPAEIKISDFLGEKGINAYLSAQQQVLEALRDEGITAIDSDGSGENFGLARKNGHWFLVGRTNYKKDGTPGAKDFSLKIIPPSSLVFYDTLTISWHNIKDRVPDAMDAFTSPNKDIALVKTENKLTAYAIGAEQLAEDPLADIELQEGETVIMAEWATGSYVDSWEKSFITYGATALSKSAVRLH